MGGQGPHGGGRGRLVAVVVLCVAFAMALTAVFAGPSVVSTLGVASGDGSRWHSGSTPPPPPPVLAAAETQAPVPTPDGVEAALAPLLTAPGLGDHVAASVVDVTTGQVLYGLAPDTAMTPASVTKLVTGVTVLAARGPAYRIPTRVVAGANRGEVVLVGGGDATLSGFTKPYYPGAARLEDLATQVRKALGDVAPTRVSYDGSAFTGPTVGPGWDDDATTGGYGAPITALMTEGARVNRSRTSARYAQPDLAAAQAFAKLLGLPASAVTPGTQPTGAKELGKVESPPMVRLVEIMMGESDNVLADALARQVALAKSRPASFEGASAAMRTVIEELNVPSTGYGLVDGSGFSRLDRLSPALATSLLAASARPDRGDLHAIFSGLPVAGYSGTLALRYDQPANGRSAAGIVRAKTGTLTGVNAIAGVLVDADGRTLAFAFMADRTGNFIQATQALDRIAAALAACGCR